MNQTTSRGQSKKFLTSATINWFDDGCCDVKYLDLWHDAPLNYTPGQAVDAGWNTSYDELIIGRDSEGQLFRKATDLLMRYQFHPQHTLSHVGDFDLGQSRWLKIGDRIVQRIHLIRLFSRPMLDIIGLVEISRVVAEPYRYGFTSITAAPHVEQGEWSAHVSWQDNGNVVLTVDAISRPSPQEPVRNHSFIQAVQKKLHQQGLTHFKQSVLV